MKLFTPPRGFKKYWSKIFYGRYANWPKTAWFHLFISRRVLKRLVVRSQNSDVMPLTVIFFVLDIAMWKYEGLFRLMLEDSRFNPYIIPYPLLWHTAEQNKNAEAKIKDYCISNSFPYIIGYDIDNEMYIPAEQLNADFVCYTQPYNNCPDFWKVEKFYHKTLIFSYPYGDAVSKGGGLKNFLTENVSWQLFQNTPLTYPLYRKNLITRGKNFNYVGHTAFDVPYLKSCNDWKINSNELKRVIIAFHHTIDENDKIPFSNFLYYHERIFTIIEKFKDSIQFAFKPHPILYPKLVRLWGKEKTDKYYDKWKNGSNTSLVTGDYMSLFYTSDALIHDCTGFTGEYLFTKKPSLHICRIGAENHLSRYGKICFQQHYRGLNENDIENFLSEVVLQQKDSLMSQREKFYNEQLTPPNNRSASENMFSSFISLFE